jgi:hypothetical protein
MARQNCWEFKRCGRQPGGDRVAELGVCPASTLEKATGINGGVNGGRACWAIVGTLCKGQVQDNIVAKLRHCAKCDFRLTTAREEGATLVDPTSIMRIVG